MPAKNILRPSDIREMSVADVTAKIAELEEERFRLNFRSATEPLEDPLRLRWIRKDIARLKTILRERTIETGASAKGCTRCGRAMASAGASSSLTSAR
mgnify:CR=1 FL=1